MTLRNKLQNEIKRLGERIVAIQKEENKVIESRKVEQEKFAHAIKSVEQANVNLDNLEKQHEVANATVQDLLDAYIIRTSEAEKYLSELQTVVLQYEIVFKVFDERVKENDKILAGLLQDQEKVRQSIVNEQKEISRKTEDLNIYKLRIEKMVKDNNLPTKIIL